MAISLILLVLGLLVILAAAEAFTNGLEGLGRQFLFPKAVVGNILAAVGTALPETILPVIAIFFTRGAHAKDIGVGAILGAPFMISTAAFFLVGMTVLARHLRKRRPFHMNIEAGSIKRDMTFFIPMYSAAVFVSVFTGRLFAVPVAAALVAGYILYVALTVRGESAQIEHFEGLHIFRAQRRLGLTKADAPHTLLILLQIAAALAVMVFGARLFIHNLERISLGCGMSPLLFSLMLAPIATELPEIFNSVTWTLKGKDALAVGNLTGAMVFQSTFPVSIGLVCTRWEITGAALCSAVIAIVSASMTLAALAFRPKLLPYAMTAGGVFYFSYLAALAFRIM
jgi:cation:H+ antiporter